MISRNFAFSGSQKTRLCNNKRLAKAWLGQFEILYNFTLTQADLKEDCGIPTKMLNIKKDLQCKDFEWYITNVYPEMMVRIISVANCITFFLKNSHFRSLEKEI